MRKSEQRMNRKQFRLFKGLIPISMAFMLMWSTGITVLAEDGTTPTGGETTNQTGTEPGGTGTDGTTQTESTSGEGGAAGSEETADAGAGDIAEDTSVALEANADTAAAQMAVAPLTLIALAADHVNAYYYMLANGVSGHAFPQLCYDTGHFMTRNVGNSYGRNVAVTDM